jgi:SAM-dependent methyltransferase
MSTVHEEERTKGLYRLLSKPAIYEWFQWIVAGPKAKQFQQDFVTHDVAPCQGSKILDIGCGPGSFLAILPEALDCQYTGFDINPKYIAAAQVRYGHRGRFLCQRVSEADLEGAGTFDIVLARGVVHHLSDDEATGLMHLAHRALGPTGRLVTIDPVFVAGQSRMARFLISRDRGKFVRDPQGYEGLARGVFAKVESTIHHNRIRVLTRISS